MMRPVRTTVTLDADTRLVIDRTMRERGMTFREAVNELIRNGSRQGPAPAGPFTLPRSMGTPSVPLTKALEIADRLEDEEITRGLATGR